MALTQFTATLSEKVIFNNKFILCHFELVEPHTLSFQAGQYILLDVPGYEKKWSYSIVSQPEVNHAIELLVDISPMGPSSIYLKDLTIGQEISFRAPVGMFTFKPLEAQEQAVFIATGSGIAPIRSMILDQLITQKTTQSMQLFWGLRQIEDMFWEEDFYQFDQEYDNFTMEIILSRPPGSGWKLSTGYVTDLLANRIKAYNDCHYYLCGNQSMIDDCKRLLFDKGVGEENLHYEKFY